MIRPKTTLKGFQGILTANLGQENQRPVREPPTIEVSLKVA